MTVIEEDNDLNTDNSNTMSVRQQIIMECMITQRTTQQTLQILAYNGFKITDRTLRREKSIIKEKNLKKLFHIAKNYDFHSQHIERLHKLEYLERGMFDDIQDCKDPYKRSKIREIIANLQPIMSSYLDYASYVAEKYPSGDKLNNLKNYYNNNNIV